VARVEITKSQREYILDRDEHHCHFPIRHTSETYRPCRLADNLEIHHITPYRWAQVRLNWETDEINNPNNLLTLCRFHHRRVIHPDLYQAQMNYGALGKEAFEQVFSYRRTLTDKGIPYWFAIYDDVFQRIAHRQTVNMELAGREWPMRRLRRLQQFAA
jgi:hypothetical protein